MNHIVLKAKDLDGFLTDDDKKLLSNMDSLYGKAQDICAKLEKKWGHETIQDDKKELIALYDEMGSLMKDITSKEDSIRVYSFETPNVVHGEASRLIAKLRDSRTPHDEFVYYIQRAYELLFNLAFCSDRQGNKNHLIVKTPVTMPVQHYAVHKIPDVDKAIENTVMCVMLRGALLPSMIMSKEIQEFSSSGYVSPFALFRIKRDDSKKENDMEYLLDLDKSFFDLESLNDKDLVFADPMNATGGSLVTIVSYLKEQGIKPRSIIFINVISALKGSLRIIRALEDVTVYTLWMDPVLNDKAYILPGLGDAGDRLNGSDNDNNPRNMIQLIADYGSNINSLYRSQVSSIEKLILG